MKSNAVGLASITMLMTFLMVTLGMSLSAYRGIEAQVAGSMTQQYEINLYGDQKNKLKISRKISVKLLTLINLGIVNCHSSQLLKMAIN